MAFNHITAFPNRRWPVGKALDEVKAHLASERPVLEDILRQRTAQTDPGVPPRIWAIFLGVNQKRGLQPAALKSGRSLYVREDLRDQFWPYWDMLEELGWRVEGRLDAHSYRQSGLHLYVLGDP